MERPQTFANTWIILQIIGFIVALEGVMEYFSDRHYHSLFRRFIILWYQSYRDGDDNPAQPRLPESWEEWYNS